MKEQIEGQVGLTQTWLSMWICGNELVREQQEKWLRLGADVAHQYAAQSKTELQELQQADDWQKLLMLTPVVIARGLQNRLAVAQGVFQAMVGTQSSYVEGWQQFLRDYGLADEAHFKTVLGESHMTSPARGRK
jgi:S-methylmethionine-dependent homocysteine/selenocysteine methylase